MNDAFNFEMDASSRLRAIESQKKSFRVRFGATSMASKPPDFTTYQTSSSVYQKVKNTLADGGDAFNMIKEE